MVFGIGFSVARIGEQPNNLEAIRRAAAYQDCHRHNWGAWRGIAPAAVMVITKWSISSACNFYRPCVGYCTKAISASASAEEQQARSCEGAWPTSVRSREAVGPSNSAKCKCACRGRESIRKTYGSADTRHARDLLSHAILVTKSQRRRAPLDIVLHVNGCLDYSIIENCERYGRWMCGWIS